MNNKKYYLLFFGLFLWYLSLMLSIRFFDFKNDIFISGDGVVHYELMKVYAKSNCWICYIPNHCLGLLVPIFYPPFIFAFFKFLFILLKNTTLSFFVLLILPIFLYFWSIFNLTKEHGLYIFLVGMTSLFYKYHAMFGVISNYLGGLLAQGYVILLGPLLLYFYLNDNIIGIILTLAVMLFARPFDSVVFLGAISIIMMIDKKIKKLIVTILSYAFLSLYYVIFVLPHSYRVKQMFIPSNINLYWFFMELLHASPFVVGIIILGLILLTYNYYKGFLDKQDIYFFLVTTIAFVLSFGLIKIPGYGHYYRYSLVFGTYLLILSGRQFTKLKCNNLELYYYIMPLLLLIISSSYVDIKSLWDKRFALEQKVISSLPNFEKSRIHTIPTYDYWKIFMPHLEEAYYIRNNENINCLYSESNPIYDLYVYSNYKGGLVAYWGRYLFVNLSNLYNETLTFADFLKIYDRELGIQKVVIKYKPGLGRLWNKHKDYAYLDLNSTNACILKKPIWIVAKKERFPILIRDYVVNKKIRFVLITPSQYEKFKEKLQSISNKFIFIDQIDCDREIDGYYIFENISCKYYKRLSLEDIYYVKNNSTCIDIFVNISSNTLFTPDKLLNNYGITRDGVLVLKYQYWDINDCFISEPFFFACVR